MDANLPTATLSTNGALSIPCYGGTKFLMKWGTVGTSGTGSATITFPTAFPTACFWVMAGIYGNDSSGGGLDGCYAAFVSRS